ncbi:hypothetical protein U713_09305 [Rhodobacter capsulatus YW2]|nr:hypothetical protein U713_09305 [Rhodobacter capsulatus YW2]
MPCRAALRPFAALQYDFAAVMADFLATLAIQLDWLFFVAQSPCKVVLRDAINGRFGEAARQRWAAS